MDYDRNLIPLAKDMRRHMTPQEGRLWYQFLRTYPIKFVRQKTIGHYIVDFYSHTLKLAVEVDGGQHYEPEQIQHDQVRTAYLDGLGIEVFRVTNTEINENFDAVCQAIHQLAEERLAPS